MRFLAPDILGWPKPLRSKAALGIARVPGADPGLGDELHQKLIQPIRRLDRHECRAGPTHEISPINAQAVVGEGRVKGQAKRKHLRLTN